jgi:hypothetical protein
MFSCFSRTHRRAAYHCIKKKKRFVNCKSIHQNRQKHSNKKYKLDAKLKKNLKWPLSQTSIVTWRNRARAKRWETPCAPAKHQRCSSSLMKTSTSFKQTSLAKFHKKHNDCVDYRLPMLLRWRWNLAFLNRTTHSKLKHHILLYISTIFK